jgi:hypothetical protein
MGSGGKDKPTKVIDGDRLMEYVGIGWVELRKATKRDKEKYPHLTDDKAEDFKIEAPWEASVGLETHWHIRGWYRGKCYLRRGASPEAAGRNLALALKKVLKEGRR